MQHWTVASQICHGTDEMWHKFIIFLFGFSLSSHFFNWFSLSPHNLSLSFLSSQSLSLSLSQPVFFPQIKPKNILSSLFAPQIKLQFPVQNKTKKWNYHKPKKNKGIDDGGKVELGARDGKAMKIDVRAVIKVREGEVCRRSVRHNHGIGINVGIDVEVRSESTLRWDRNHGLSVLVGFGCRCKWIRGFGLAVLVVSWVWVASASGFWLCFLGLSCCVFWVCLSVF